MSLLTTVLYYLATTTFVQAAILPQKTLHLQGDHEDTPLPLIIWHGLGDGFENAGLQAVAALAEETNPGTFAYLIRLADTNKGDSDAAWYGNLTEEVDQVCRDLAAHKILSTAPAVDGLGFSQGGVFLRAYIERCNSPPVRSFVTFGSPHNGISEFQDCNPDNWLCLATEAILRSQTWGSWVQGNLVPAQYYRDPTDLESYLEYSNFLADINNERALKNQTYKQNLENLEKFVLYKFDEENVVVPSVSSWFATMNGTEVIPLRNRTLYKEDWLGLKKLDEKGGLEFKSTPGKHMQLSEKVLKEVFKRYFGPSGRSFESEEGDAFDEL